jgi:hypothetical protein
MTDLSQMIRWNAGFVRNLAQTVLERAKTIRTSLSTYSAEPVTMAEKKPRKKTTATKKPTKKSTPAKVRTRRTHA